VSKAHPTLDEHLSNRHTPKRILALDGGGLRGVLTVGLLSRIEEILRARAGGDPDFRLCHYFDLIGGTSTGAIIAAGLAVGMRVAEIREHYYRLGNVVFKRDLLRLGLVRQKYDARRVDKALHEIFGDHTLGSSGIRTGLMIMTKRLDTTSPWPLTNNPNDPYFNPRPNSTTIPNRDYPLWKVVRASTAAPYYFAPEFVTIKEGSADGAVKPVSGEFIDGGVSTANNPSLQMVQLATLHGYGLRWPLGDDQMLVVSLGTGRPNLEGMISSGVKAASAAHAARSLVTLMSDCNELVETMMQWLSSSPTARRIDRVVGDLHEDQLGGRPLLSYARYNVEFEDTWLRDNLGVSLNKDKIAGLEAMDDPANLSTLEDLGIRAASKFIQEAHFPAAFDLR
jgi:hypothetical protein